jgi:benzodiazapine receptor
VEIILMWFLILLMIFLFIKVNRIAGWLLIPYLVWVLYAAVLNGSIWWLNHSLTAVAWGLLT